MRAEYIHQCVNMRKNSKIAGFPIQLYIITYNYQLKNQPLNMIF